MEHSTRSSLTARSRCKTWRKALNALLAYRCLLLEHLFIRSLSSLSSESRLGIILGHVPREMLTPIGHFFKDGHNSVLYRELSLTHRRAIILGGYLGDSAEALLSTGAIDEVVVLEPIEEFVAIARSRFQFDDRVTLITAAAAQMAGVVRLYVDGEKTSQFGDSCGARNVPCVDIAQFFIDRGPFGLLEINIEGGEFDVLSWLLDAGIIGEVHTLLIQFHRINESSPKRVDLLRQRLEQTHTCVFAYDWVWERWERK
jgi:FkbM family methyltransferase